MRRPPAVQGRFYPGTREKTYKLISDLEANSRFVVPKNIKGKIIGSILPHAGILYSGTQTIPYFKVLNQTSSFPDTFIILNPNHSGTGPDIALEEGVSWYNDAGEVEIDLELNKLLPFSHDASAQRREHSAEVLLPYIQYFADGRPFKILPICLKNIMPERATELAGAIKNAVETTGRNVQVIASSDFSHFLTPDAGRKSDDLVLEEIKNKDISKLENVVLKNGLTICGYCPIMVLMSYAALVDAEYKTTILARGNSGEVIPSHDVVDYISILFHA